MTTEIKVLKAFHGDCILIKTFDDQGSPFNILIDGGPSKTYKYTLRDEIKNIKVIHLLILTHIDSDHIAGFLRFFKSSKFDDIEIKKYWFNGPNLLRISNSFEISYKQGKTLEELLLQKNEPKEKWEEQIYYTGNELKLSPGINCKILSPTKDVLDSLYEEWPEITKDIVEKLKATPISGGTSTQISKGDLEILALQPFKPSKKIKDDLANSSSIAFILELPDTSILLLGDARTEIIERSLREFNYSEEHPVEVDFVKVSHHGSKNNTSTAMLDLIKSEHFIISTNGGFGRTSHPDREIIARIIYHPNRDFIRKRTIYFNYPLEKLQTRSGQLFTDDDLSKGNWTFDDSLNSFLPLHKTSDQ